MYINIYGIVHPVTKEVVYIGQTADNLEHYLKTKYWKLNEVKRGGRNWTKLFHFLNDLLPLKAEIVLIRLCDTTKPFDGSDFLEKFYIKKYKELNPNLLNETDGGFGGNTYKYKTKEELKVIGQKLSLKLKGKKKPEGFSENLSNARKGAGNPRAFKFNVGMYKNDELIRVFNYRFEIIEIFGNKSWDILKTSIKMKRTKSAFGYIFKPIE